MVPEIELRNENLKYSKSLRTVKKRNNEIHSKIKKIILSYNPPTKNERYLLVNKWIELYPPISRRLNFIFFPSFGDHVSFETCEIWFKPSSTGGRSRLFFRKFVIQENENNLGI
ncbi:hypothetical protein [Leptospira interrogans]|uniref:hypothetical protein n=1 Tax=Leptospira interrogans TaxID=173 RepID=UPI00077370D5|nr:hypothetical protein [Leptospira interrogans]